MGVVLNEELRRKLIEKAVDKVKELLKDNDLVVVVPPGSSRTEIANKVVESLQYESVSVVAITYRDYPKFEDIKDKVTELVLTHKTRILLVPRDTTSALRLVWYLKENDKTKDTKICVLNVAGVYKEELGEIGEHYELDYTHVQDELKKMGVKMVPKPRGISLSLLGRGCPKTIDEILTLGPDKAGIRDLLRDVAKELALHTPSIVFPAFASAISILLGNLSDIFQMLDTRGVIRSIARSLLKTLIERKKENFKNQLFKMVMKARVVEPHVENELYEGVVDSVASNWGLTIDEYANFIKNISSLIKERATDNDVRKFIDEKLAEIENELRIIEERLNKVEHEARMLKVLVGSYRSVNESPYIRLKDGVFYLTVGGETCRLATTDVYEEIASKIATDLLTNKLVVIQGSAGSGKSVLTHYVAVKILLKQDDLMKRTVYVVNSLESSDKRVVFEHLLNTIRELGEQVILLYDPVYPELYSRASALPEESSASHTRIVSLDVEYLLSVSKRYHDVVSVIIVLPTAVYEHVEDYLEKCFKIEHEERCRDYLRLLRSNTHVLDDEIRRGLKEFVNKVIQVYSGCQDVDVIAGMLSEFNESHALIAKHVGLFLKEKKCHLEDIQNLIKEARRRSRELVGLIVKTRLDLYRVHAESVRRERLGKYAIVLALRAPFVHLTGFGMYIITPELMSHLMRYVGISETGIERNHVWLSMRNEDLVEEVFESIVDEARKVFPDLEFLKKTHDVREVVDYVLEKWGNEIWSLVDKYTAGEIDCLRRLVYLIGFAPFELASPYPLEEFYRSFRDRVSLTGAFHLPEECRVDKLFLVDREMPLMVGVLLIESSLRGLVSPSMKSYTCLLHSEALDLVEKHRPSLRLLPYLVGVSLISLDSDECGKEAVLTLSKSLSMSMGELEKPMLARIISGAGSRVEKVHGKRFLLPLIVLDARVGDILRAFEASKILYLFFRKELKPWEKALLVELFSDLIDFVDVGDLKDHLKRIRTLIRELHEVDKKLGLLSRAYYLLEMAHFLTNVNELEEAEKAINKAGKLVEKLKSIASRGELTIHLTEYLKSRRFGEPKILLKTFLDYLERQCSVHRARLYYERGIRGHNKDLVENAIRIYNDLAERHRNACEHYRYRLKALSVEVLATDVLSQDILARLEELWDEVKKTPCFVEAALVQASLVSTLATLNRDWEGALEGYRFLRGYHPRIWFVTDLLISALGSRSGYDFADILSSFRDGLRSGLAPWLLLTRGLSVGDKDLFIMGLRRLLGTKMDAIRDVNALDFTIELSLRLLQEAISIVTAILRVLPVEVDQSLLNEINKLDLYGIVSLATPTGSTMSFILILDSISRGDLRLAKLHALISSRGYGFTDPLFGEIYKALCEAEKTGLLSEEIKYSLLKLYFYHFVA